MLFVVGGEGSSSRSIMKKGQSSSLLDNGVKQLWVFREHYVREHGTFKA